jgi:hypothetical protein
MARRLDLVGLAEVAEILDTSPTQAKRWIERDGPKPVARLRATSVWMRSEVTRWAKQRKPNGRRRR